MDAFWIEYEDDRVSASDGVSRFSAYVRQHAAEFAECWEDAYDEESIRVAHFAATTWRVATGPIMAPGYVRYHPRIRHARIEYNYWDGSLTVFVDVITGWPQALAQSRDWQSGAWWRDWPTAFDQYVEPSEEDFTKRPYLMASAALAFPVPTSMLPVSPSGPDELLHVARQVIEALVIEVNRVVSPVIATLERNGAGDGNRRSMSGEAR